MVRRLSSDPIVCRSQDERRSDIRGQARRTASCAPIECRSQGTPKVYTANTCSVLRRARQPSPFPRGRNLHWIFLLTLFHLGELAPGICVLGTYQHRCKNSLPQRRRVALHAPGRRRAASRVPPPPKKAVKRERARGARLHMYVVVSFRVWDDFRCFVGFFAFFFPCRVELFFSPPRESVVGKSPCR